MMVASLHSSGSHSVTDLVQFCDDAGCDRELMRMVDTEHAVLLGLARLSAEARKEARENNAAIPGRKDIESARDKWLGSEDTEASK